MRLEMRQRLLGAWRKGVQPGARQGSGEGSLQGPGQQAVGTWPQWEDLREEATCGRRPHSVMGSAPPWGLQEVLQPPGGWGSLPGVSPQPNPDVSTGTGQRHMCYMQVRDISHSAFPVPLESVLLKSEGT